jgi:hypothetical protein
MEAERTPRTIQLFSSNEEVLFFPEKYNSPIILVPNMPNDIKYVIYPKREESTDVLVHCVDISNRELIRGWLIRILPEKPEINHIHNIDCKVGSVTNIKYEFTNSLNSWVIFNFWGLGIGDWGLGIGPNPQSPIPNPQSPFMKKFKFFEIF